MKKSSLVEYINLQVIKDDCLMCVAQHPNQIPFPIKRVYYMVQSSPNLPRGYHTHKELDQVFFCIQGSMRMVLDNGRQKEEIVLSDPSIGIRLKPMVWHEMHDIKEDTIMLIFASDAYKEADYIRKYDVFMEVVNAK
jgi:dTDP-4-dehydrorhamnose 3,5-epimerase-like enzyme